MCVHMCTDFCASLSNWVTFLTERAPPLVFVLLAAGPSLSGLYLTESYINTEKFIWALIGQLVRQKWCILRMLQRIFYFRSCFC